MTHVYYCVAKFHLIFVQTGADSAISWEVQRYDGWYNNLADHDRGAAGEWFMLFLKAFYKKIKK